MDKKMKYPFNHQNQTNNKCYQCKWFVEGCTNKVWCLDNNKFKMRTR